MRVGSPTAAAQTAQPGRAAFALIFAAILLDMLVRGIIVPVLPGFDLWADAGATAKRK
jgi:hypothetical protein